VRQLCLPPQRSPRLARGRSRESKLAKALEKDAKGLARFLLANVTYATGELAGGAGCTGKLTFTGYIDPGTTCAVNAPFHAKALGLPPVKRVEAQSGVAGSQPVLLYDAQGNVVGSEQAQFLTAAATDPNDPGYMACNTPQGLTSATWSDTVELFAP
jgi:hypothetical protein